LPWFFSLNFLLGVCRRRHEKRPLAGSNIGDMKAVPRSWRLVAGLLVFCAAVGIAWFCWTPGLDVRDGRHDRGTNAIWMQHGWFGDDAWFERNHRVEKKASFRVRAQIKETADLMRTHRIAYVFPHLCPAQPDGAIAPSDAAQVEQFLDAFDGISVLPWVGGVYGDSVRLEDSVWRKKFVASCVELLVQHPRLAGIHLNVEPMPSGNPAYLALLDELHAAMPAGKKLSVAAYPPPTYWQPSPEVHWDEAFSREVAARVDQAVVMMYDTSLHSSRLYKQLMKNWTIEALAWYAPREVLLGLPAYEDAGVSYHDPKTENLANGLTGIHAGLGDNVPPDYAGVSIYCEWEMTAEKWQIFDERFQSHLR